MASVIENHKNLEPIPAIAATCTEAGRETGAKQCTVCGDIVDAVIIPALGHDWSEITYTWADDNNSLTAARKCGRDHSHDESETVSVTQKITSPTATKAGKATYTSGKFKNTDFVFQTKTVNIPKINDMKTLNLPKHLESIETRAFENGSFECVIVQDGCTEIKARAFADCTKLLYVCVPKDITIADDAFAGCKQVVIDKK